MRRTHALATVAATAATAVFLAAPPAHGQQAELCDTLIGGVADATAASPVDDTTAGLQATCNESFAKPGVVADPLLCGIEQDLTELAEPLGGVVGSVHAALDDDVEPILDGLPTGDIVDLDHPCAPAGSGSGGNGAAPGRNAAGGGSVPTAVQAASGVPDGSLPRTGAGLLGAAALGLVAAGSGLRRLLT